MYLKKLNKNPTQCYLGEKIRKWKSTKPFLIRTLFDVKTRFPIQGWWIMRPQRCQKAKLMEFDQFFTSFTWRYKSFESMTIYCSVNINAQIHNKPGKMTQIYTWLDLRVSYYFFKENFSFEKSLFDIPGGEIYRRWLGRDSHFRETTVSWKIRNALKAKIALNQQISSPS